MGRLPVWQLVHKLGWHAMLAEPAPPTFQWLQSNFKTTDAELAAVRLLQMGLTANSGPHMNTSAQVGDD